MVTGAGMTEQASGKQVVPVANLREYFRDALETALAHQQVTVEAQTQQYVVNLLTLFARSEALYDQGPHDAAQRARLKPLVVMLTEALQAPTEAERQFALQRMGDVSLFIAGFFAPGFACKLIDIDYHIAMGGRAYGTLADSLGRGRRAVLGSVFAELAGKFQPMVDALNEISETAYRHSQRDVLRLYEVWLKTGSERARRLLQGLGVTASPAAHSVFQH
jgi:hypothetical protein